MKNRILTVGALALGVVSAATADFTGWSAEVYQSGGYYVMNVYATSNANGDQVLNVCNLNVTTNGFGGFHQGNDNPFWAPGSTQNMGESLDSWITLGTHDNGDAYAETIADANLNNFDDSNGAQDFSQLQTNGSGAGWGVGNPNTNVNVTKAITNGRQGAEGQFGVLVAHFVVATNAVDANSSIVFLGGATVNGGEVSDGQQFAFVIPGPGALALLGIGGLVASRRRRA
jgi:hypothetical protein